ncbi:MAG: hypothetical protein IJM18_06765 [Clostridia bacterium]|nr:hypothetical protein [Clostridia bacterium]
MTDVRGFELRLAEDILRSEGYNVVSREVRSKKGVPDGADKRVIRVRMGEPGNTVYLAYSVFKTEVTDDGIDPVE